MSGEMMHNSNADAVPQHVGGRPHTVPDKTKALNVTRPQPKPAVRGNVDLQDPVNNHEQW